MWRRGPVWCYSTLRFENLIWKQIYVTSWWEGITKIRPAFDYRNFLFWLLFLKLWFRWVKPRVEYVFVVAKIWLSTPRKSLGVWKCACLFFELLSFSMTCSLVVWGIWRGTDSVLSSFRTDCRWGLIWYALWMALVSRNSIRLALICVPPFGCGRWNTSCSLNSFFEIPWFDGGIRPPCAISTPLPCCPRALWSPQNLTLHALEYFLWNSVVWRSISTLDWLVDWLLSVSANLTLPVRTALSCAPPFQCGRYDTSCSRTFSLEFRLLMEIHVINPVDHQRSVSAKFDTSSVEFFLGTWFFDGAHASFCALIGGRWNRFCFLPSRSRLWCRPRMIRCSCLWSKIGKSRSLVSCDFTVMSFPYTDQVTHVKTQFSSLDERGTILAGQSSRSSWV